MGKWGKGFADSVAKGRKRGMTLRVAVCATMRCGAHVIHRVGIFGSAGIAKRMASLKDVTPPR